MRSTRRIWKISYAVIGLLIAFLLALGYSYFIEPSRLVVNQQTLEIKGWDPALDGFKIVAIGDIHGGSNAVDEAKLHKVVELANEQNADLIVLLGDYVSQAARDPLLGDRNLKMPMHTIATDLAGLKAKYGVVAVMGNHDWRYGDEGVERELPGWVRRQVALKLVPLGSDREGREDRTRPRQRAEGGARRRQQAAQRPGDHRRRRRGPEPRRPLLAPG